MGSENVSVWNTTEDSVAVEPLPVTPMSLLFAALMSVCIVATVVGNILVILSVFTYRPLRHVANFYIVSLAIADLSVAVLVMPYNVVYSMLGYWPFGGIFCLVWATCDILACTASILHLCAIAVDRYRAIHDPITYAQKRTIRRVLVSVFVVWFVSGLISIPPLLGWNDSGLFNETTHQCQLTNEPGFVVYSASGSFYVPLVVMVFVYIKIYLATRARLRARASAANVTGTTIRMTTFALATATATAAPPEVDRRRRRTAPEVGRSWIPEVGDRDDTPEMGRRRRTTADVRRNWTPDVGNCDDTPEVDRNENEELEPLGGGDGEEEELKPDELPPPAKDTDDRDPAESDLKRSLVNGLSPRRFRTILVESARRYKSSRVRLADDVDAADGGDGSVRETATGNHHHLTQFLAEKQRISLSRERRAARTMAVVMGAFVLCWLPFFLMYVTMSFCESCYRDTDRRVINFIVWLGYVNSTLNPLIYTVFNVDFRRAFSILLHPGSTSCRRAAV